MALKYERVRFQVLITYRNSQKKGTLIVLLTTKQAINIRLFIIIILPATDPRPKRISWTLGSLITIRKIRTFGLSIKIRRIRALGLLIKIRKIRALGLLTKIRRIRAFGPKIRIKGVMVFGQTIKIIKKRANGLKKKVRKTKAFGQIIIIIRAKNKSLVIRKRKSLYILRE